MTYDELIEIFESTESLPSDRLAFAFREGLQILFDLFDESEDVYIVPDQICYGDVCEVLDKITPEQCKLLAERNWFINSKRFSYLDMNW